MGKGIEYTYFQRRHTYKWQQVHEKVLNITNIQENANQNYSEISSHAGLNGHHQKIYKQ